MRRRVALALLAASPAWAGSQQTHPDVVGAKVSARGADVFDFDVTVSSPYDTPQRYADAFRVVGPDGKVYGVRIPPGIKRVTLQGRDRLHGWGGGTSDLSLPGR